MRLSVLSSVFILASVVIALPVQRRDEELSLRDEYEVSLDARDDGFISLEARDDDLLQDLSLRDEFDFAATLDARGLERRVKPPKLPVTNAKKQANKDNRKAAKKNAKAEIKGAGDKAAQQKKASELKTAAQNKHNILSAAGKEHKKMTDLPNRTDKFTVPAGGGKPEIKMTGKDVRQGMFNAQVAHQKKIAANGPKMTPPTFGDKFKNQNHKVAQPGTTKPIDGMTGPGREHTYSKSTDPAQRKLDHSSQPVRLITQGDQFKGVISHDQSRTGAGAAAGENDHFKVHPTR